MFFKEIKKPINILILFAAFIYRKKCEIYIIIIIINDVKASVEMFRDKCITFGCSAQARSRTINPQGGDKLKDAPKKNVEGESWRSLLAVNLLIDRQPPHQHPANK